MQEVVLVTEVSIITDEMRRIAETWQSPPHKFKVEEGAIRKFARAIGDPNPLWQDEQYAKKTKWGGIIAPPTFLNTIRLFERREDRPIDSPFIRHASAGDTYEIHKPIRPGDTITIIARIKEMYEKKGKGGRMFFVVYEKTITNQNNELVAKAWWTSVTFE